MKVSPVKPATKNVLQILVNNMINPHLVLTTSEAVF